MAPHKPLLLLWLLGRAARGEPAEAAWSETQEALAGLLREFGPPRPPRPEYPFTRLQRDGVWEVHDQHGESLPTPDLSPAALARLRATGRIPADLWAAVRDRPPLRDEVARTLLHGFWPSSLHDAILRAVGLDVGDEGSRRARRDPAFRLEVLRAYEWRCAACGFDGRLRGDVFGLDAAHVRWHCYGGPSAVDNGLALCSLHHLALDRGVIGMDVDHRIKVSADLVGGDEVAVRLVALAGKPLRSPQSGWPHVAEPHIRWHSISVFRDPARGGV